MSQFVATREFTDRHGRDIVLGITRPEEAPQTDGGWRCAAVLVIAQGEQREAAVAGTDSIEALFLALEAAKKLAIDFAASEGLFFYGEEYLGLDFEFRASG